jgi:hypothetical protein
MYQSIEDEKKFLAIQDSASASAPVTSDQSTRKSSLSKKVIVQNLQITNDVSDPVSVITILTLFWYYDRRIKRPFSFFSMGAHTKHEKEAIKFCCRNIYHY